MSKIGVQWAKVTGCRKTYHASTGRPVKAHHRKSTHDLCAICRKAPSSLWPPCHRWNDCLLRDFQNVSKGARRHMYEAITFQRAIFRMRGVSIPLGCFRTPGATGEPVSRDRISWRIRTNSITYGARHGIALALSSIWQPETKSSSKRPPTMA